MKRIILMLFGTAVLMSACTEKPTEPDPGTEETTETNLQEEKLSLPDVKLDKGDQSDDVKNLQRVLVEIVYPIEVSGKFDDLTTWALTDIQLQSGLDVTGFYDDATKLAIEAMVTDEKAVVIGAGLKQPEYPDDNPEIIENPYDVLAVVNKSHALPNDYVPSDLVVPNIRFPFTEDDPKKQLRQIAVDAIEELFAAGDEAGVTLYGQSGYRSYDRQEAVFASYVSAHGEEQANTYSARAGESEHQTGLVMDVTSEAIGFDINDDFGMTDEGIWLKDHAHEYGFIIRYPEDKVDITKYQYEPWHIRYVGKKVATKIYENGETLEEYFGIE